MNHEPRVEIIEQPAPKALRFRYECEGRSAGSIPGVHATNENKSFPTIKIVNFTGRCMAVVSCVTKDQPYMVHPHNLVGKDGKQGVCTAAVDTETMTCQLTNLGIQCVKKKEVERSLEVRRRLRIDPFKGGYDHGSQPSNIDLNAVRLCFHVFAEGDEPGKFTRPLPPVVSEIIYDKKANTDLQIIRLSDVSCSVAGGKEMILLCEKVAKDDIEVHFTEEKDGQRVWLEKGEFQPSDVHRQYAIPFRTPAYSNIHVQSEVKVKIQLVRPSDGACSEPRDFTYLPLDSGRPFWSLKKLKANYGVFSSILATNTALMTAPRQPITISNGHGSDAQVQEVPDDSPQEVKIEPAEEQPGPSEEPVYEFTENSWDKNEQKILDAYSEELAQDENCKSLNDLLSTVAELEEMYPEPQPDPDLTECLKHSAASVPTNVPMDVDDSFESGHYTSLQLAMKNPILIDIDFEDPPPQPTLILPTQNEFILPPMAEVYIPPEQTVVNNKRESTTDKLPPLPPKRFRKNKDDDSSSIITIDEPAPELPPRANPPLPPTKDEPTNVKQKSKNFFQKLFSRKGGRKNKPPGLPKTGSVPCNLSEVNQNSINSAIVEPPSPAVDLTEAEHYALYTDVAPRANCSEFDETSFYYSPVEGIAEKPLPPEPQKSEKRNSVSKISGSIRDIFS
ncbi:embryonic polarity protein dorsal-like isoform X2 [Neocloeon triangulifer]|nr:embryonic polarity protein dorsal-like isoform X2 [Neocloeon triangulifer]